MIAATPVPPVDFRGGGGSVGGWRTMDAEGQRLFPIFFILFYYNIYKIN